LGCGPRVLVIGHAVAVYVGVARVALAVLVEVGLDSVLYVYAVVRVVVNAVAILVGLTRVVGGRIRAVGHTVAVYVAITSVALIIVVLVLLVGIGHTRAVVFIVGDAVFIPIRVLRWRRCGRRIVFLAVYNLATLHLIQPRGR